MIHFEPRQVLDKAIIKTDEIVHYNYEQLVECFMELFAEHGLNESYIMAIEWIDFNILGRNIEGWPNVIFKEPQN